MDTAQAWATILTAIGAGTVIPTLIRGVIRYVNGSAGRERGRNADLVTQRDHAYDRQRAAERERDAEARKRRVIQEYASRQRRRLIELGVPPSELEPWPTSDNPQEAP